MKNNDRILEKSSSLLNGYNYFVSLYSILIKKYVKWLW